MVKIDQDTLEVLPEDHVIAFGEMTEHKRTYLNSYPLINEFNGRACSFGFPEGGVWDIVIPLSSNVRCGVVITIMEGWVEYEIIDCWGKNHYLYIRSSESEVIFKSILSYKENYGIVPLLK